MNPICPIISQCIFATVWLSCWIWNRLNIIIFDFLTFFAWENFTWVVERDCLVSVPAEETESEWHVKSQWAEKEPDVKHNKSSVVLCSLPLIFFISCLFFLLAKLWGRDVYSYLFFCLPFFNMYVINGNLIPSMISQVIDFIYLSAPHTKDLDNPRKRTVSGHLWFSLSYLISDFPEREPDPITA